MPTYIKRRTDGTAKIRRDGYSNDQTDWWTIRDAVFTRDGGRCKDFRNGRFCNEPGREVHHIIALGRGGVTSMSNLITLCQTCHDRRHVGHTIRRDRAKPTNPWGRKKALPPYRP